MSKVKFIQLTATAENYQSKIEQALQSYPGAIIFVANNGEGKQEIWANGLKYEVGGGGINVEGVLNNVLTFGENNTVADSGISKNTIDEGYTKSEYDAVNASEIDTLDALRARIVIHNTKTGATGAPENYTFDDFIKDLFQKVNAEQKATNVKNPSVTASVTGGNSFTLEVGDEQIKTTDVIISKGTYTDGSFNTWADTDGKSTDIKTTMGAGCTAGDYYIKVKDATTSASTNTSYTEPLTASFDYASSGELTIPNTITKTSKQYVVEQEHGVSTTWEQATTSYGNPLFNSNPITTTKCISTATAIKQLILNADFYHFVKGTKYLGTKTHTGNDAVVGNGSVIYIPNGWNWSLSWIVSGQSNSPASSHYTEETVYLELPSGGDTSKFTSTIPQNKGYKTYKKITFNENLPAFTTAESPRLIVTKN